MKLVICIHNYRTYFYTNASVIQSFETFKVKDVIKVSPIYKNFEEFIHSFSGGIVIDANAINEFYYQKTRLHVFKSSRFKCIGTLFQKQQRLIHYFFRGYVKIPHSLNSAIGVKNISAVPMQLEPKNVKTIC